MRLCHVLLACALLGSLGCHPRPIAGGTPTPSDSGTIAGIVTTADSSVAAPGRKVTAINTATGARYDTTTAANGGYTIKVPEGTYHIEIELRAGEALAKHPDDTRVARSDVDSRRDFVITAARSR
jgi:hypothetical protein